MTENVKVIVSIMISDTPFFTLDNISAIKGVQRLYEVSGQYDAVATISVPIDELNDTINKIKRTTGVTATNSILVLKEIKK